MSMDPGTMQQMLMQRLAQPAQAGGQPQGQPMNPAAQLAQKAMLVRALQGGPQQMQQHQANSMLPGTQGQIAQDPAMQALQQAGQVPSMQMGQPSIPPPNGMPTPGFS